MKDIDRLILASREGDLPCAQRLWREARRAARLDWAAEAAVAMHDFERTLLVATDAWRKGESEALSKLLRALGVVFRPEDQRALQRSLDKANGRRQARLGTPAQLLATLIQSRHRPPGVSALSNGIGAGARAKCTSIFAVRDDHHIHLSVGVRSGVEARAQRAWQENKRELPGLESEMIHSGLLAAESWASQALPGTRHLPLVETRWSGPNPQDSPARVLERVFLEEEDWAEGMKRLRQHCDAADAEEIVAEAARLLEVLPDQRRVCPEHHSEPIRLARNAPWAKLYRRLELDGSTQETTLREIARSPNLSSIKEISLNHLRSGAGEAFLEMLGASQLQELCDLSIHCPLSSALWDGLSAIPKLLAGLQTLKLSFEALAQDDERACARFVESLPSLKGLKWLRRVAPLPQGQYQALEAFSFLARERSGEEASAILKALPARLGDLEIGMSGLSQGEVDALHCLEGLESLSLSLHQHARKRSAQLWRGWALPRLERLILGGEEHWGVKKKRTLHPQRDALVQNLTLAVLPALQSLNLKNLAFGPTGARALAGWPSIQGVEVLNLSQNQLGDEGLKALVQEGALDLCEALSLDSCEIGPAGMMALTTRDLPMLRVLNLNHNRLSNQGFKALARWPTFARLERLILYNTRPSQSAIATLEASPYYRGQIVGISGLTTSWMNWRR